VFPTEQDVYHRLRWDGRFDVARCSIVFALRPTGTQRVPFLAWDDAVPWHRIVEFWVGDTLAWSRPQRIDRLDELAAAAGDRERALGEPLGGRLATVAADAPPALRIALWNLLFDRYSAPDGLARWTDALDRLAARDPDVVVLAEVTPRMWELILAHPAWAAFAASHPAPSLHLEPYGQVVLSRFAMRSAHALPLSRDKRATLVTLDVAGRTLGVAALHLTSNRKPDAAAIRAEQLAAVLAAIRATPRDRGWLVAGDFNASPDELAVPDAIDAWERVHGDAGGLTFDVVRNPLAAAQSRSGRSGRLDRIHAMGPTPIACELVGDDGAPPSDHYGVVADVMLELGRLALAVVPPTALWGPIQRVRCAADLKFAKWPPHITIELPFDGRRVPDITPFDVELERTIALGAVHALAPADPAPFRALGVATPHLTVARGKSSGPHNDVASAKSGADELRAGWRVERLVVLGEHAGRFTPLCELAARRGDPAGVARIVAVVRAAVPGAAVVPFGSAVYAPACALDVDLLVASSADAARIATRFGLRAAGTDRWRGTIDGTPVDILATTHRDGADDARALRDHLIHHGRYDAFVAALPRVRAYAHARGLLHNGLGYFGMFGWAQLLADPLAHDRELCAVPAERAFDAWFAHLPRLATEPFAIPSPSGRDIARHLTPATTRTLLAELRAPSLVDLADAPPPGTTLVETFADDAARGAYTARVHDRIAALEAAGAEPRVWGRFDGPAGLEHRITVRDS
jgi:endonuclease/exonuclease/phosphatase family metal-dependent hydrolase